MMSKILKLFKNFIFSSFILLLLCWEETLWPLIVLTQWPSSVLSLHCHPAVCEHLLQHHRETWQLTGNLAWLPSWEEWYHSHHHCSHQLLLAPAPQHSPVLLQMQHTTAWFYQTHFSRSHQTCWCCVEYWWIDTISDLMCAIKNIRFQIIQLILISLTRGWETNALNSRFSGYLGFSPDQCLSLFDKQ